EFTFSAEIDAMVQRWLTRSIAVHVAYQGLYLDNVTQSASQIGSSAAGRGLWLHGLVLGGQWSY
ncbi:MAG: hypothetical protein AAF989_09270, partial [Planctomycetota bacterium]